LEISVWEERVSFVASSIGGSPGRLGRLKDSERYGTGDEDEKSVNGTQISIKKFPPRKRDYFFRNFVYSEKFSVERTKKSCSIYIPTGIFGFFWQMENALSGCVLRMGVATDQRDFISLHCMVEEC